MIKKERDDVHRALSAIAKRLHPFLSRILQSEDNRSLPLIGSGFMQIKPGAQAQELHKDIHHYDRHGPVDGMSAMASPDFGKPRTVSIQLQLTNSTGTTKIKRNAKGFAKPKKRASLEVLPGSHRPDAPSGRPEMLQAGVVKSKGVVPLDVEKGTVTVYSSRLWHRGGPNESQKNTRVFCFFTVMEPESPAPPGLIHTMMMKDIGAWGVTADGLQRT